MKNQCTKGISAYIGLKNQWKDQNRKVDKIISEKKQHWDTEELT